MSLKNISKGPIDVLMQQTEGFSPKEAVQAIIQEIYPQVVRDRVKEAVRDSSIRRRLTEVDPEKLSMALKCPVSESRDPLFSVSHTQDNVMGPEGRISKGLYTIYFLPAEDPLNLVIGRMTGSCMAVKNTPLLPADRPKPPCWPSIKRKAQKLNMWPIVFAVSYLILRTLLKRLLS